MMSKYPLLGMTLIELQSLVKRLGMPGFAAKQIASWLYDKKVTSIDEMTNLSLKYRELLKQNYEVGAEAPVEEMRSVDGTVKYLYPVGENHFVESVYIPDDFMHLFAGRLQNELQVLYDRETRLLCQPDRPSDYQSDSLLARTGQTDECRHDGNGRTAR